MSENTGFRTVDVYHFILDWAIAHQGNTPSQRQIAAGCGCSNSTAHHHTQVLIGRGLLERKDGELIVVRSTFSVPENAWEWEEIERVYPDILSMTVIPKDTNVDDLSIMGTLDFVGLKTGAAVDEEFLAATYPDGWKYQVAAMPDTAVDVYFLIDGKGTLRATLRFDKTNYKAKLHFWEL